MVHFSHHSFVTHTPLGVNYLIPIKEEVVMTREESCSHVWINRHMLWCCRHCPATHLIMSPKCGGEIDLADPETEEVVRRNWFKHTPPSSEE